MVSPGEGGDARDELGEGNARNERDERDGEHNERDVSSRNSMRASCWWRPHASVV